MKRREWWDFPPTRRHYRPRVEAECKGGSILRDIERNPGDRTTSSDGQMRLTPYQRELSEAGLKGDTAHRWQVMSWAPEQDRRAYRYGTRGYYRTYQPSDWNSSVNKKIIDVGWQATITIIKMLLITALTIIAFGASWLIVTVLTL
jgi:hypothetical protein